WHSVSIRGYRATGIDRFVSLLTETAAAFFEHLGYSRAPRAAAPATIAATAEFASLCPDTAVCMRRVIA
ncbi:MAG: hypothetical protein ACU85V_04495, partial [Gammaproteobacteria bacterium]